MDRRASQATIHGIAKSQTWLKWLSRHTGLTFIPSAILNPLLPYKVAYSQIIGIRIWLSLWILPITPSLASQYLTNLRRLLEMHKWAWQRSELPSWAQSKELTYRMMKSLKVCWTPYQKLGGLLWNKRKLRVFEKVQQMLTDLCVCKLLQNLISEKVLIIWGTPFLLNDFINIFLSLFFYKVMVIRLDHTLSAEDEFLAVEVIFTHPSLPTFSTLLLENNF